MPTTLLPARPDSPRRIRSTAPPRPELAPILLKARDERPTTVDLRAGRVRAGALRGRRPVDASTDTTPPPDPTALCCAVVRSAVEVLRGERTASHLVRWVTPRIHDALARRARLTVPAHSEDGADLVTAPVRVRRARVVRLGEGAAEGTVVVEDRGRVRAAAVRLEARRGTWRVVALEIG